VRPADAEAALTGLDALAPDEDALARSADAAARECAPVADANGSVEYKRQLVRVLSARCVREALAGAAGPR
jgi:CO/xanthine dehydrogenase FAD-binding subunit